MAHSKCVKCRNTHFEIRENLLANQGVKVQFVQCTQCGTPVGVLDHSVPKATMKAYAGLHKKTDDDFKDIDQQVKIFITSMLIR